jgi:hypothetical protein
LARSRRRPSRCTASLSAARWPRCGAWAAR